MPNSLIVEPLPQHHIDHAGGDGKEEILSCLEYIKEHPEPDGDRIIAIQRPPAVFFTYRCGIYEITFYVSWAVPSGDARITVMAIAGG